MDDVSSAQVGFVPVGKDAPEKLCFKRLDYLNDYRYCIELLGTVYLGDGSSDTTAVNYFNKRAALTWDCETYEMSNGLHRPAAAVHQQSQQLPLEQLPRLF